MKKSIGVLLILLCLLLYSALFVHILEERKVSRDFSQRLNSVIKPENISLPTNSFIYD